jgi:hypothetical protein
VRIMVVTAFADVEVSASTMQAFSSARHSARRIPNIGELIGIVLPPPNGAGGLF